MATTNGTAVPQKKSTEKKTLAQLLKERISATYTRLAAGSEQAGRP